MVHGFIQSKRLLPAKIEGGSHLLDEECFGELGHCAPGERDHGAGQGAALAAAFEVVRDLQRVGARVGLREEC
jgi:hypothetical protein